VSEELLAAARQACPDAALRRMSAVNFCFPAPLFDAIYSIDVLEHLHPDDTPSHFTSVFRSLAPGGRYIVMTPHAHVGPHDVSRYFDPVPTGFHLKEYTYRDVLALGRAAGFTRASSPALPLRAYRPLPWLLRPTLFPASWKIFVERLGKQIPGRALRGRVYKALMLYTVCAVFEKPGGR
jgi:SAM-dependent methyltransferase